MKYEMKFCPVLRKLCDYVNYTGGYGQPIIHICDFVELPLEFLKECPKDEN